MLAPLIAALRHEFVLGLEGGLAAPFRARLTIAVQQAVRSALLAGVIGLALLAGLGFLLAAAQMGLARLIGPPLAALAIGIALLALAGLVLVLMGRKTAPAPPIPVPAPIVAPTALPGPVADYLGFLIGFVAIRALLRRRDRKS
jgi:hypothetical protein